MTCVVALLLGGCAKDEEPQPTPEQIAYQKVQQAMEAGAADEVPASSRVEVSREGTTFDPPVEIGQLPGGVWYCDMGTVHYARRDLGDGKCAVCNMTLQYKNK
jgi:hypothetical protein